MPRATTCLCEGKEISIEKALELKNSTNPRDRIFLNFECTECGKLVRPHKSGGNMAAHFEHIMRNPTCNLSDPKR